MLALEDGLKKADKIAALPGQPKGVNFDQYSGYVTVDPKTGRALFYYFAESENASTKPLVLWLNGGPGCSSFGNGAMKELGPFGVNKDGKTLWRNEYAWNKVANILFLESPADVGFSYSNSKNFRYGDDQTAADNYVFLVNWLERFPEYKDRDFFLAGESYAGHYVPQLAKLILDNNKRTNHSVINLKRIAIGNAYVDYETENIGTYDYFWSHSLIPDTLHSNILSTCNFSSAANESEACFEYRREAEIAIGHIFIYDIYAPLCSLYPQASSRLLGYDPCSDYYVNSYLNTPEVQKALHVNPRRWDSCNQVVALEWSPAPETVLPTI